MNFFAYLHEPSIPVGYFRIALEVAENMGLPIAELLDEVPEGRARLESTRGLLSPLEAMRIVQRAGDVGGDGGLAIACGLAIGPTSHGLVGFAAMTSETIRDAARVVVKFSSLRQPHFEFELAEDDDGAFLSIHERSFIPLPLSRTYVFEVALVCIVASVASLLGQRPEELDGLEICFDFPAPSYFEVFRTKLPPVRHDAPANGIRVRPSLLARRPVLADAHAHRDAVERCMREVVACGTTEDLVARVMGVLGSFELDSPVLQAEVARRVAMSPRSLTRKLQQSGTSFGELLRRRRLEVASELLTSTEMPIRTIGDRTGYADPASFTRAFIQWTGETPTSYRERMRRARSGAGR